MKSAKHIPCMQRMPAKEIGGGEAFAAFGLDFEEVEQTGAAADEDAAGIGSDDGAGRGANLGGFDGGAVDF